MHCQTQTKKLSPLEIAKKSISKQPLLTMRVRKGHQISVTLRHPGRNRLATILIVLSVVGVLTSLTLIAAGALLHFAVAPYAAILDTYDGVYLPVILFALGVAGMAVDSLLMFLLMDFGKEERADHFGKVCLAILSCAVLTTVAGVIFFVHIREVKSSFQAGIANGMNNYKVHREPFLTRKFNGFLCVFLLKTKQKISLSIRPFIWMPFFAEQHCDEISLGWGADTVSVLRSEELWGLVHGGVDQRDVCSGQEQIKKVFLN